MWYDPARDGSGISLEIQNGVGFGLFYSYTEGGEPTWYAFSGDLVPMDDDEEGYWTLESPLTHFTGGVCIDCPYQEPEELVTHGQLRMTVVQRNLISYTIDGGQEFRMQPLVWGTPMATVFPDASDNSQPIFEDEELPWSPGKGLVPWALTFRTPDPDLHNGYLLSSNVLWVGSLNAEKFNEFWMLFNHYFPGSTELYLPVQMACGQSSEVQPPGLSDSLRSLLGDDTACFVSRYLGLGEWQLYVAPLGDVGDDYFIASAEDGSSIEGHRLLYR